jgi:hypothetical protein
MKLELIAETRHNCLQEFLNMQPMKQHKPYMRARDVSTAYWSVGHCLETNKSDLSAKKTLTFSSPLY